MNTKNLPIGIAFAAVAIVGACTLNQPVTPSQLPSVITVGDLTTFDGCGPGGNAKPGSVEAEENPLKNRFTAPATIDSAITIDTLMTAKVGDNLDQNKGASITGFVPFVKPGAVESCNCASKVDLDTHIYVVPIGSTDKTHSVIVEITPRIRAQHPTWTQGWLKANLMGHVVRFTGYVLNDEEHKVSSFNDNPSGRANWRQTVWEIHPVTGIEIIK